MLVILDNSSTTHIWNGLDDYEPYAISYFDDTIDNGVLTVDENIYITQRLLELRRITLVSQ